MLAIADALVATGLRDAGYVNVNLDCGWTTGFRDATTGDLETNTTAFPHGLPWLAAQLHERGLKFGIYGDAGAQQCCSRRLPGANDGSYGKEEQDAKLFAAMGVDYLKCVANDANVGLPDASLQAGCPNRGAWPACAFIVRCRGPCHQQQRRRRQQQQQ